MTFVIQKNNDIHGLFIHIPKCGGRSTIKLFEENSYQMTRPFGWTYFGHYKLNYSLRVSRKHYPLEKMKNWKIYIPLRDPIDWMESNYRYYTEVPLMEHALKWEHENLKKMGIIKYMDTMMDCILNGTDLPSDSPKKGNGINGCEAWRSMEDYFTLSENDVTGLENVEVIMWTNKTMNKLLDVINPDHKNTYSVPWVNKTIKKNNILDETSNNTNLFEEYKEKIYNANLRHHLDKMNTLFNSGIYRGKLTDFVVKDYPELKNMNSMMD